MRAEELLQSASNWHSFGLNLDGSPSDLNPEAGTVAPKLDRERIEAKLPQNDPMLSTLLWVNDPDGGADELVGVYDVEAAADRLVVNSDYSHRARLRANFSENSVSVSFHNDDFEIAEELLWSKDNGTITISRNSNAYSMPVE